MSALAHVFEAAGLATVGVSLVRGQAERARAPRMLHCEFPLGRPLGKPHDPAFQHRVLAAAFALLPRSDVPVLVDFSETIDDEADLPLSCAVPPRSNDAMHPAVDEVLALRPAYERTRSATGRTGVVRMGGPDIVAELVAAFVRLADGLPIADAGIDARKIGPAALDVRAYYEEAALALADHVPAARQAESWFYRQTHTGAALRQARDALRAADVSRGVWFALVPTGQ
ncbi:MAG: hypothetical protein ABIQ73_25695 [Acidimicrobiales bacterium]